MYVKIIALGFLLIGASFFASHQGSLPEEIDFYLQAEKGKEIKVIKSENGIVKIVEIGNITMEGEFVFKDKRLVIITIDEFLVYKDGKIIYRYISPKFKTGA